MTSFAALLDRRLVRVRAELAASGADACVVTHLPNIAWLTGFRGTAATLLVTSDALCLMTDFRYAAAVQRLQAAGRLPDAIEIDIVERAAEGRVARWLRRHGARRVGFEAEHVTVASLRRLERALAGASLLAIEHALDRLRAIKDSEEQRIYREAAAQLATVALRLAELVRGGETECDVAAAIDFAMRRAGFERAAFETIVASGPNSALPHARPSPRVLETGDPVVLDFGGIYSGYCVDLTRTAVIGQPTDEFLRLFTAVQQAHTAAVARVQPGIRGSDIDRAAREVLERHGLGAAFSHATGHGLGLEVHEYPRLARVPAEGADIDTFEDPVIEAGMIFTIEPGAYVPPLGGVRIEDDVLVGPAGAEILTDIPRDLLVLGE
jgi:Xaa-Pro aminopeptidase